MSPKRKVLKQNNMKNKLQWRSFIETFCTGSSVCMLHVAQILTINRDFLSCREAGAHQSAEHDLCTVPPYDFPAAAVNLLPNLLQPELNPWDGRGEEAGDERGRSHTAFNFVEFNCYNLEFFLSVIYRFWVCF